ncbi:hypothetical protein DF105_00920 [Burkholderia stagnalis]|uniref:hypothetical protein n=1 Tax=Burkholderia stagnalis TaxID=1503054 RepID=UPI000F5FAF55|nr:hypothetical protein [Burkholderia stagnalis]RQS15527.1 hypothetical protein DIE07_03615 [Burkholderia sp. Bp9002]RQZ08898.1 hypothetical protein DF105_00920 [Burkholderia stagnalis]
MKNTVTIGGRVLPVPPASLKSIRRWLRAQQDYRDGTVEYLDELSEFISATLTRESGGTPNLDRDWLESVLDELTIPVVLRAIYTSGGVESGEAAPAQSTSTGTSSTPT